MYTELFQLQSDLIKALAHPRRIEIVRLLREQPLTVTQIYEMLDLPLPNISQHLMILRDAKVVTAQRDGKQITYSILDKKIIQAVDLLREVLIEHADDSAVANQLKLDTNQLTPIASDPVRHMRVSPATANFTAMHDGKLYFFCASGCLKKFTLKPEKYSVTD